MQLSENSVAGRRAAMKILAQSDVASIERGLAAADCAARFVELRAPEVGLVMLRGRIGGNGAPFNVGEASVTRAAVQLESGERGFAYILGRDPKKARLAAICDALWQAKASRERIEQHVLAPLRVGLENRERIERERTAATKVDFFTLVRGEDEQ
ncbi:MAG TPA: phosphonate C-P lyase system protein PhnG [Xanthobacteraceae bacterium]|nr:phosphonate C-P lyase system protein PhnG [Xanthobacteraceae bacterium]